MFAQMIFGRVDDRDGLRVQWDRWHRHLATGATGWLGTTGGVTGDGRMVLAVRFESGAAAKANSERPEQGAWWAETEACLDGQAEFLDTADVTIVHEEEPAAAGFVQVMRARVADRQRLEEVEARIGPMFLEMRPDMLGAYRAWFGDDRMVAVDYFRSESEARAGESKEMPEELRAGFAEWMSQLSELEWFNLTEPWLSQP
jgi:hypothetical protein